VPVTDLYLWVLDGAIKKKAPKNSDTKSSRENNCKKQLKNQLKTLKQDRRAYD
jgi:hypothetical protein